MTILHRHISPPTAKIHLRRAALPAKWLHFVLATPLADQIPREVFNLEKNQSWTDLDSPCRLRRRIGRHCSHVPGESRRKGEASVIGTDLKTSGRFAAFANGVGIHADDFDDTQLAVAEDRVYGLLTHPTAPCLPAALSEAEIGKLGGLEFFDSLSYWC